MDAMTVQDNFRACTHARRGISVVALAALLACASLAPAWAHTIPTVEASGARGDVAATASGIVRALTIVDRVGGTTARLVSLVAADGARFELRGAPTQGIPAGATATVSGRRNGDTIVAESARTLVTKAAAPAPEQSVEGTLAVAHADDLERGTSAYVYEVERADGSRVEIDLGVRADMLMPGMRVAAHGTMAAGGQTLAADALEILALPPASATPEPRAGTKAAISHAVLVVLFKFSNTASDPFPVATAQSVMGSSPSSVAGYYAENSFGQHLLNVTVTSSWLQSASMAMPATCNNSDWQAIGNAADAAATAAGYNGTYDFRVYVFPRVSACGWSGLGYIGNPHKAYINGSMSTLVVAHEMGHNFGLLHAASLDCGTAVIGGTCTASEYGDPFDVMGNQRPMHFNAAQKSKLGWLPAGGVATHSSGTAIYTLAPIEAAGATSYAVKIPVLSNRTYWLEYRQPLGADAALSAFPNNGAQIRVATPFESNCSGCADDTQFLDLTPSTGAFTDGALAVGSRYRDGVSGLTINVTGATSSALTVSVGFTDTIVPPDFNGSGTTDLLWFNATTGATDLWLMNGASVAGQGTLLADPHWVVAATGDFDGNGKSDLIWHNATTGNTSVWLMNGSAMASGKPLLVDPNWRVVMTGDFNGDGKSDLVWQNDVTGTTSMWLMNGSAFASGATLLTDPNWRVTHTGDFDGDGMADLVWRNGATGATAIWLMNGATFKAGTIVLTDPNWQVTHVADFDADGKADLLWRNSVTGTTSMWLMNGAAMASGKTLLSDINSRVVAVGDFDNDGRADLVWRNVVSGATSVWLMSGSTMKASATLFADLLTTVSHVGDFDGDGRADLILRNDATGATDLWLMNGTSRAGGATLQTNGSWRAVNPQ